MMTKPMDITNDDDKTRQEIIKLMKRMHEHPIKAVSMGREKQLYSFYNQQIMIIHHLLKHTNEYIIHLLLNELAA